METSSTPIVTTEESTMESILETSSTPIVTTEESTMESILETSSTPIVTTEETTMESILETSSTPIVTTEESTMESILETSSTPIVTTEESTMESILETSSTPIVTTEESTMESILETSSSPIVITEETTMESQNTEVLTTNESNITVLTTESISDGNFKDFNETNLIVTNSLSNVSRIEMIDRFNNTIELNYIITNESDSNLLISETSPPQIENRKLYRSMKSKWSSIIFFSFLTSWCGQIHGKIDWSFIQRLNKLEASGFYSKNKQLDILPHSTNIYHITDSKTSTATTAFQPPTLIVDLNLITKKKKSDNSPRTTTETNILKERTILNESTANDDAKTLIDFDLEIIDFVNFEQKNGLLELNAKINYKWWNEPDLDRNSKFSDYSYPSLNLKRKNSQSKIHNQIHVRNNFKMVLRSKQNLNRTLQTQNSALVNDPILQPFSYIEQNVTWKFFCNDYRNLDTASFPMDIHNCQIAFDIVPTAYNKMSQDPKSNYFFALKDLNLKKTRILSQEYISELIYYNKLISLPSNYSLISKEWTLKKIEIKYFNSSSNFFQSNSSIITQKESKLDRGSSPARLTLKFWIYRKREPQVYIYILPIILFTLLLFTIFFMPNTESSEKSLISFFNFISLVLFNLYQFKLLMQTYGFQQLPFLLQYSNCLMVIQLGVLAYTSLVKSVHQNGFLILNNSFTQPVEESFKEILEIDEKIFTCSDTKYHRFDKPDAKCLDIDNTDKCLVLNRNDSIEMGTPTVKFESENEAMNAISTTVVNDENYCFSFNRSESNTRAYAEKCCCNMDETDADCCNNGHCANQVLTKSTTEPKVSLDEFVNEINRKSQTSFEKNELMISMNNGFNRNWILSCCGTRSPDLGKISPSPICEHVRPSDLHRQKLFEENKKLYCISQASTKQVIPECDYTSHLARLHEPQSFLSDSNRLNDLSQTRNISFKLKSSLRDSNRSKERENTGSHCGTMTKLWKDSSQDISSLNVSMQKMIKFEEILIRDRILRDEWKRKARLCDGICCLLVFFLLS
ncbi:isoform X2, partial [Brachionus plicatilis]